MVYGMGYLTARHSICIFKLLPETNLLWINICIFIEQFGYGFGFTAYMLYLIYFSRGIHSTAHYAICTAFMALGMMLPGMIAGWMQELLGYQHFFLWIVVCCAATFGVTALLKIDPEFGKNRPNKRLQYTPTNEKKRHRKFDNFR